MAFGLVAVAHYDNSSSNSAVVAKPTGTADNDIMFAFTKHNTNEAVNSVPAGWAQLGAGRWSGAATYFALYWKLATSEGSDYTFGWATASRTGVTIAAYRDGFDTADPIDVVSDTVYVTLNTSVQAATMTVTAANSPIIVFAGVNTATSGQTFSPPTTPDTMTENLDYWETNSRFAREISSIVWSSSGATGTMDATFTESVNGKHAFAVALNPATGGSPITDGPALVSVRGNIRFN